MKSQTIRFAMDRSRNALPKCPRFVRELVVVIQEDEVIVDGADQLHVFEGKTTADLLSTLIPLMDGHRTLQQLQTAMPSVPDNDIEKAALSLLQWGLVEDGDEDDTSVAGLETLGFLRRYNGATNLNSTGKQAYDRLQASTVFVLGSRDMQCETEWLCSILLTHGIGRVIPITRSQLIQQPEPTTSPMQTLVVSISFTEEDCQWHKQLDDWCFKSGFSWLRAVINKKTSHADLGPLFHGDQSPCYCCFHAFHVNAIPVLDQNASDLTQADIQFFSSLIAIEITYLLSRIGPLVSGREFQRYDLEEWLPKSFRWARVPGCSRCQPLFLSSVTETATERDMGMLDTAAVFENYMAFPSRQFPVVRLNEQFGHMNAILSRQAKRLSHCPQYSLNRRMPGLEYRTLEIMDKAPKPDGQMITRDDLATMLMIASGIRDVETTKKSVQRWTATAGNLGSVEIFLAVQRVQGLDPGIYFYQPFEHSLALFRRRSGRLQIDDFMRRAVICETDEVPDVLLIFTAAYHRVAQKYAAFAYRLVNMDAGVAMSQLHLIAKSLNISSATASRWADDLIEEQLNLDPLQEQSTAVIALSRNKKLHARDFARYRPDSEQYAGHTPKNAPQKFNNLSVDDVATMLYHESRLHEHQLRDSARLCYSTPLCSGHQDLVSLPRPACEGRRLNDVLIERRSVRTFTAEPVSMEQLSLMLYYAHQGDADDWPREHDARQPLTFWIFANRVVGLDRCLYQYQPENHCLLFSKQVPFPENLTELFVQTELAFAPVSVWIAGDLGAACARLGAFGHRQLLLRAGAAGQRLWTTAAGAGLSGVLTAGIVAGAARQVGFDGYQQAALLSFITGNESKVRNTIS